ncbi:MAG: nucleotidyltransferase family protein [Polyangia bacterium]
MSSDLRSGELVASLLSLSWRAAPPTTTTTPAVIELAISGGSGALAHRRLDGPLAASLKDLVRHQILEAARFEAGLKSRLRAFREAGIDVLLVKGWAIARRYPQRGLRHYSDLDLVIDAAHRATAEQILAAHAHDRLETDLHFSIPHMRGRDLSAIRARLVEIPLGDVVVTTLGDEDHLWLLALHGLGHGLWRSVWLVDLAVMLEQPLDFDYLYRGQRDDVQALKISLRLAQQVLGADGPAHAELPRWLEPALMEQWGRGFVMYEPLTRVPSLNQLVDDARRRWPNPIRATAQLGGPWNEWPRLPVQLLDYVRRLARFARAHDDPRGIWAK